ncbi:MAG: hypothetical protein WA160_05535 [Pseudobdellovibrio sp.]
MAFKLKKIQLLYIILFSILSFYVFQPALWVICLLTILCISLFPEKKIILLSITPFIIVALGAGPKLIGLTNYFFLNSQVSPFSNLEFAGVRLVTFLIALSVSYCFVKFRPIFSLTLLLLLCTFFSFAARLAPSAAVFTFLYLLGFMLIQVFWVTLIDLDQPTDLRYFLINRMQLWTAISSVILPLPLLLKLDVGKTSLPETQKKGVVLFSLSLLIHLIYGLVLQILIKHNFPGSIEELLSFRRGSVFLGANLLKGSFGNQTIENWASLILITSGVLVAITTSAGYSVAIARMCGYDMPANSNRKLLNFSNFNEFLQGIYYYYNYILMKVIFPRVKTFSSRLIFLKKKQQLIFSVFLTIILGGVVYNSVQHMYPYRWHSSLFADIVWNIQILPFLIGIAILITLTFVFQDWIGKIKTSRLWLYFLRFWIVLIFSLLITLKASISAGHLDLYYYASFFQYLFYH